MPRPSLSPPAPTTAAPPVRFGTVAWASANHGRLTRHEQLREAAIGTAVLLRSAPAQVRWRLGFERPGAMSFDIDQITYPDSAIARDAEAACRDVAPAPLLQHSYRTYLFGMLLARHDHLTLDPELYWVACLTHDLCLTEAHQHANAMPCFGARAGIFAGDWAIRQGWPADRSARLGDIISLHLNARVGPEHGPEAQMLQASAGIDVIGMRAWDLDERTVAAVHAKHPRGAFLEDLHRFGDEAVPGSRTQLLTRLGFMRLARASRLNRYA